MQNGKAFQIVRQRFHGNALGEVLHLAVGGQIQDKDRQRAQQHQRQQPQKKCAHRMRCFPGCEDIGVLVSASHGVLPESMVSISL